MVEFSELNLCVIGRTLRVLYYIMLRVEHWQRSSPRWWLPCGKCQAGDRRRNRSPLMLCPPRSTCLCCSPPGVLQSRPAVAHKSFLITWNIQFYVHGAVCAVRLCYENYQYHIKCLKCYIIILFAISCKVLKINLTYLYIHFITVEILNENWH